MQGFFVYHTHFKIGKIINYDQSNFLVRFFAREEGDDCRFAKDALEDGDLQRIHLPLGTRCRVSGDSCVVERVVKYVSGGRPAVYEVALEGRELKRQVTEVDLDPLEIVRADPLTMLASQQQEGYPLFRTRERLVGSMAELVRQGGGLRALLASRIDLRPHQAYVAGIVLQDRLRRYLLADEVGLGKTVEAGIIIQDLLSARPDARVLILCPGALTQQWLCELYSKFNYQVFTLLELHQDSSALPAERRRKVIAPLHAALGPEAAWLAGGGWDLVVVDEVHHLVASERLLEFVDGLSRSAPALLLLSALPAQQRKEDFLQLLSLLEPERYSGTPPSEFHLLYDSQAQIGRLLRRLRRRLESDELDRDDARRLASDLTTLPALSGDPVLQARASSLDGDGEGFVKAAWEFLHAGADRGRINRRILRNRRSRLVEEGQIESIRRELAPFPYQARQVELEAVSATFDLLRDGHRQGMPDEVWSALGRVAIQSLSHPDLAAEFLDRLGTLGPASAQATDGLKLGHLAGTLDWAGYRDALLGAARSCLTERAIQLARLSVRRWQQAPASFARFESLLAFLRGIRRDASPKLVLFAGFPGLASRIAELLGRHLGSQAIVDFRSEMRREEKEANVTRFRTDPATWLLVCDETGGEGRNFQFAEAIIHFDTPWYVSRVEQRIGRLDRLGSTHAEITSHVFFCPGTPESDLVRCFAEGYGVYTRSISGLEFALRELESGTVLALLGSEPIAIDEYLPALAEQVEEERMRDDNEAALDEASFDREAAERFRRGGRLAEAERATEDAFTGYLAMVANDGSARPNHDDEFPEGVWLLRSDEFRHVQIDLPETPRDGTGRSCWKGTFRREIAQARLDLQFFTVGHPLFDALTNTLSDQPTGRTYAIDVRHPGRSPWMGFELVFTAVADPGPLGLNLGLMNRAKQLFTFRPLHVFVNLKNEVEPSGQSLLDVRQAINLDAKDSDWANLTKQKVERLDRLDGWRERVLKAAELGRNEARRRFRAIVEPAIEPEVAWLKEQIRQATLTDSGDAVALASLQSAIEQWQVVLDGVGLLSINGNLLGRR